MPSLRILLACCTLSVAVAASASTFNAQEFLRENLVIDGDVNYFSALTEIGQPDFSSDELGLSVKERTGIDIGSIALSTELLLNQERTRIENGFYSGVRLIRTSRDIHAAHAAGEYGTLFYMHSLGPLGGDVERISHWRDLGARVFQVRASSTALDEQLDDAHGLTPLGHLVVDELIRLRMLVDLSHANEETTLDVAAKAMAAGVPIMANHASAYALRRNGDDRFDRGKTDAELQAIAGTGGVIGVFAFGPWLQQGNDPATVADFVDHLNYIVDVVGIDHVGISTDARIDGQWNADSNGNPRVSGDGLLDAPDRWFAVAEALHQEGYSDDDLRKVFAGNFLRVYEQVLPVPEPGSLTLLLATATLSLALPFRADRVTGSGSLVGTRNQCHRFQFYSPDRPATRQLKCRTRLC